MTQRFEGTEAEASANYSTHMWTYIKGDPLCVDCGRWGDDESAFEPCE